MTTEIENAKITGTMLGREDHGILTFELFLDFGGACCAFGGYALDRYDISTDKRIVSAAGLQAISEILDCVGVEKWEDLTGKYYCEDAFCNKTPSGTSGQRKTGRAYRRVMIKQKTNRLMKIVNSSYIPHAGYVDWDFVDGKYIPVGKYIKYPKNSNKQRWIKRYSNKIVRNRQIALKGNGYKKVFDYWWTMY